MTVAKENDKEIHKEISKERYIYIYIYIYISRRKTEITNNLKLI